MIHLSILAIGAFYSLFFYFVTVMHKNVSGFSGLKDAHDLVRR